MPSKIYVDPQTGDAYQPLGGKSRNYINLKTGEKLSRRQFDKRLGLLKRHGFSSYEKASEASKNKNLQAFLSRPARGRSTLRGKSAPQRIAELSARKQLAIIDDYVRDFDAYYFRKNQTAIIPPSAEVAQRLYDRVKNFKGIFAWYIVAHLKPKGRKRDNEIFAKTVSRAKSITDSPRDVDLDNLIHAIEIDYKATAQYLEFGVVFKTEYLEKHNLIGKRKRKGPTKSQLKKLQSLQSKVK